MNHRLAIRTSALVLALWATLPAAGVPGIVTQADAGGWPPFFVSRPTPRPAARTPVPTAPPARTPSPTARPSATAVPTRAPLLAISPNSLDFGAASEARTAQIANAGQGTLSWRVLGIPAWLSATPQSGTAAEGSHSTVTVMPSRGGRAPGTYTGTIQVITDRGATGSLSVRMVVERPPQASFTPARLDFGSADVQRSIAISNIGGGTLVWTIASTPSWVAMPVGFRGTTPAGTQSMLPVTVSRVPMAPGSYSGSILIRLGDNSQQVIPVQMVVPVPKPISASDVVDMGKSLYDLVVGQDVSTLTDKNADALDRAIAVADIVLLVGTAGDFALVEVAGKEVAVGALEATVKNTEKKPLSAAVRKLVNTIKNKLADARRVAAGSAPESRPTAIYDLPKSQGQLHLHGAGDYLTGGRIYSYDRSVFRALDAFESAMADYYAQVMKLKKVVPK